jgi:lambda family phage portal protein
MLRRINAAVRAFLRPPTGQRRHKLVRARYDAAQTTPDNTRHWRQADNLSADSANSPEVRRTLRARARYEIANNSYAKGIVSTIAAYTIGTGPKLQVMTDDNAINDVVEDRFFEWADECQLAAKMRTMRMACVQDGEVFAVLKTNPKLESPVKLDIEVIEADRVTHPGWPLGFPPNVVDGIEFDEHGNPTRYLILKQHPGDLGYVVAANDMVWLPADYVIHYYHADRPGQHRGIPEITPALPLFAQLRRYTLAEVAAAETAASFAAVLQSDTPTYSPESVSPFDIVELEPRMATVLPAGWKIGQVETAHPPTSYREFVRQILCEIARCMNIPLSVALGDSSDSNYASGRLDTQNWYRAMKVERSVIERVVLAPILRAWLAEAILVSDYLPIRVRTIPFYQLKKQWFWDGIEHVDPVKEAQAAMIRLQSGLTTLSWEYAKEGRDWESEVRQIAKERALMQELGVDTQVWDIGPGPQDQGDNTGDSFN